MGERLGWPRIAGRILAFLLICEPPQQDTPGLAAALRASKASISTMTRFLIDRGFIERCAPPGDRRVYYRARRSGWAKGLRDRLLLAGAIRALLARGVELVRDREVPRATLEEGVAFYDFMLREIPALFERWDRERGG